MMKDSKLKGKMLFFILFFAITVRIIAVPVQVSSAEYETPGSIIFEDTEGNIVAAPQTNAREIIYGNTYSLFVKQEEHAMVAAEVKENSVLVEKAASSREGYDEFVIIADKVADMTSVNFKKTIVTADADGMETTEEICTDFYVKVAKRVIHVDAEHADISYSKVYDSDLNVFNNESTEDVVTFNVLPILADETEGILSRDSGKVSVDLKVPDNFAGVIAEDMPLDYKPTAKATAVSFRQNQLILTGDAAGNYVLADEEITVPASVTVSKRIINITVSDAKREYGHGLNNHMGNEVNYNFTSAEWVTVQKQTGENSIEGILNDDTDFIIPDYKDALKEVNGANDESVPSDTAYVSALSVDTSKFWLAGNTDKHNNYNFIITNGDLTVVKEAVSDTYLDLNTDNYTANTTMYIQDDRKIWVRAQKGSLNLNVKADTLYNQVILKKVDNTPVTENLTEDGYEFDEKTEETVLKTLTLYLHNSETGIDSEEFECPVYLDGGVPTVEIEEIRGEETTLDKLENGITFGNFEKTEYKAVIHLGKEKEASGLDCWQYAVLPMKRDLTKDAMQVYMEEMMSSGKLLWSTETAETKDITIVKKNGMDEDFIANNYVILVKPFDKVNNSKVYTSMGFILDDTAPVVELKLADGQEHKTVYDDDVKLQAIVSDDKTKDSFSGIKEVYYQTAVGKENLDKASKTVLYEAGEDKTYSLDELKKEAMVLTKDISGNDFQADKELNSNNIWVMVTAVDNSENDYAVLMPLKIDTTKPVVTVDYETEAAEKYVKYYNKECRAVITVKERNIDYKSFKQLYFDLKREKDADRTYSMVDLQTVCDGIEVEIVKDSQQGIDASLLTDARTITILVKFAADDKYNFDVNCVDEAGWADEQDNAVYFVIDKAEPNAAVAITNLSQAQNGIFNENVSLKIDVEDMTAGDTYSGLEKVWYTLSASGNIGKSDTITLMDNSSNRVQNKKTFSQIVTVPAEVYNSNEVRVQVFATDFAGNKGESDVTELGIDVTEPVISVAWDLNNPLNGKYYKDTRTAMVTVTDRNFDPDNVRFGITNTEKTSADISGWTSCGLGVSDKAASTCYISFPAEGDYTFTLRCTDLAGNIGEYGQTDEFTIDKTLPVLTVTYDNNDAKNGNFYRGARTATITVREHNFNASEVCAAIEASLQGNGIAVPSISGFSNSGDTHTATVNYRNEGDYTFDIDCTDMAGNQAVDYVQDDFTVDLTAPTVEIAGIEDKSANNDVVSPVVNVSDLNYDAKNVMVEVTGANNGTVDIDKVINAVQNGQNIKVNDFPRTEKMDDLYEMVVRAVDKAGNESEKSINFSVNRYGSIFVLDDETNVKKQGWLSTDTYTYINQEKEVGIIEYNVDVIELRDITVNKDGELKSLREKDDYTVLSSGSEVQWKENHYKIKADNFTEEGNYTIILNTMDRAKNQTNNSSVKSGAGPLPLKFTLDKTAPTVVVSGIEDGGRYRLAKKNVTVDVKDNLALAEVTININDRKTVYTAEDLRGEDGIIGVIQMTVPSTDNWQNINISAKDMAGNIIGQTADKKEGQPIVLRVLVTPNVMIQFYMNKPLFYSSIIGVVGIIAAILFLIGRRERKC